MRATCASCPPSVAAVDWFSRVGELLPRATETVGVRAKLATYSLDPNHPTGGPKARGFAPTPGITDSDVDYLEQAIREGILVHPNVALRPNPSHGVNCVVEFPIRGSGRYSHRRVDLRTVWQVTGVHGRPRLITAFPKPSKGASMVVAQPQITENDYVELRCTVGRWPAGTRGTAVLDHGKSKLIEVSDERGQMLDLFEVSEADLKLISQHKAHPSAQSV